MACARQVRQAYRYSDYGAASLDRPVIWGIFGHGEMCSCDVIVFDVRKQHAPKIHFAQNDHMVQAFAPDGADHAFDIAVLRWGSWRGRSVANTHGSKPPRENLTIRAVVVADEKGWGGVPRKGFG